MTALEIAPRDIPATGSRVPLGGIGLVLCSQLSLQFGAAVAVSLFPRAGAMGVVSVRLGIAALLMLVLFRPRLRGYGCRDWGTIGAFGIALAGMNFLFYQAISRIPMGAAVTIEVLGPLLLSVLATRRLVSCLWAVLAFVGVALLGRAGFDSLNVPGVAFALAAGVLWASYIVLSQRTGHRFPKTDGLALAMTVSAVITVPLGVVSAGSALFHPAVLGLGTLVALLSSALPYTLELRALRRLPAGTFAVMMSLSPAFAAAGGFLVLGQRLNLLEAVAIVLVVIATAGAVRSAGRAAPALEPQAQRSTATRCSPSSSAPPPRSDTGKV